MIKKADREFSDHYFPRPIYFAPDLCDKISSLYGELSRITNRFTIGYSIQQGGRTQPTVDFWQTTMDELEKQAKPLFDDLRLTFHNMLYRDKIGSVSATETGVSVEGDDDSEGLATRSEENPDA